MVGAGPSENPAISTLKPDYGRVGWHSNYLTSFNFQFILLLLLLMLLLIFCIDLGLFMMLLLLLLLY